MSKRILTALEYPEDNIGSMNFKDETTLKKVVVWLEKNKIQQAPPDTRNQLFNINSPSWRKSYDKYKNFLGCPEALNDDEQCLRWLAGYAVQVVYNENKDKYTKIDLEDKSSKNTPDISAVNPLDKLDLHSNEFTEGINQMAKMLNITPHIDPTITLAAVKHMITERVSQHAVENPSQYIIKGTPFPVQDADLGFDLSDPVLKNAAKILRMLYIQDLRNLQTRANELIVSAQNITANPKTDTRLGKVGF